MDILGTLSPYLLLIIFGSFILFMTQKKGWKWQQIISGVLLLGALYGTFPSLPQSINTGLNSIVTSFEHTK
jgi:hypothetical protein